MADKVLGVVLLALCAASQAFIRHSDTAMFFSLLFGGLGASEFVLGEIRQRKRTTTPYESRHADFARASEDAVTRLPFSSQRWR
jgi:hypothetical protein